MYSSCAASVINSSVRLWALDGEEGGKAIEVEGVIWILPLVEGLAAVTGLSVGVGGGLGGGSGGTMVVTTSPAH